MWFGNKFSETSVIFYFNFKLKSNFGLKEHFSFTLHRLQSYHLYLVRIPHLFLPSTPQLLRVQMHETQRFKMHEMQKVNDDRKFSFFFLSIVQSIQKYDDNHFFLFKIFKWGQWNFCKILYLRIRTLKISFKRFMINQI